MRVPSSVAALLLCSCSAAEHAEVPPDLHGHMVAARKQVTPIYAPDSAVAACVSGALAAKSLQVVSSDMYPVCGRIAAVDSKCDGYVLSWERATASPNVPAEPECVLLFVSSDPAGGAVTVGELAEAVRLAAERAG